MTGHAAPGKREGGPGGVRNPVLGVEAVKRGKGAEKKTLEACERKDGRLGG